MVIIMFIINGNCMVFVFRKFRCLWKGYDFFLSEDVIFLIRVLVWVLLNKWFIICFVFLFWFFNMSYLGLCGIVNSKLNYSVVGIIFKFSM